MGDAGLNDAPERELLIPSILGYSAFLPFNLIFRERREEEPGETIAVEIVKEFPVLCPLNDVVLRISPSSW